MKTTEEMERPQGYKIKVEVVQGGYQAVFLYHGKKTFVGDRKDSQSEALDNLEHKMDRFPTEYNRGLRNLS